MNTRTWIVLAEVAALLVFLGATALVGPALAAALLVLLGLLGIVVFLPSRGGRKTTGAMCLAGFFAALHFKAGGQLQVSDVFLFLAGTLLVLGVDKRGDERPTSRSATPLLYGLLLISVGGFVGGLFQPAQPQFAFSVGYQGAPFGPISARFGDVVRFTIVTAGLVILIRMWKPGRKEVRAVLAAYGAGVIFNALYGLAQGGTAGGYGRVVGLTTQPVYFGLISAFGVLVGLGFAYSSTRWVRWFGLAVTAIAAVGVFSSGTRSALSVAIAGVIFMQIKQRSLRSTAALISVLVTGLFVALAVPPLLASTPLIGRLQGKGYARNSTAARDLLRNETLALIRGHGITGAGFRYIVPPHNLILGVLAATGIAGLAGLIIVAVVVVTKYLRVPTDDMLSVALLSAGLSIFANSWVLNAGWDRWLWLPLILVVALPLPAEPDEGAEDGATPAVASEPAGVRQPA